MADVRIERISRELFVSAVGTGADGVEPWVIDRLTGILREEEARDGDVLFEEEDAPDAFYFLRQGRVELTRGGHRLEILDGPSAFGLRDVLLQRPRSLAARAQTPALLMRIDADGWLELLEDSSALARASVRRLIGQVASLEERGWAEGGVATRPAGGADLATGAELDPVERLIVLRQAPLLRGAGVQPLSDLAAVSLAATFAPGERLLPRPRTESRVFVVVDGRVEATRDAPRATWQGGPGQIVCGTAGFGESIRSWEAHALVGTRTLSFGVEDWFDIMEENFDMVRSTLAFLASERERLLGP